MLNKFKTKILWLVACFLLVISPIIAEPVVASELVVGPFTVAGDSINYVYDESQSTFTITGNGDLDIANTDPTQPTKVKIIVQTGIASNITLSGININVSGDEQINAFDIQGTSTVNITLASGTTNILASGYNKAGLNVRSTSSLNINGAGELTSTGGKLGAGIGGNRDNSNGTITINSGTVNGIGGDFGAGIGSGDNASNGSVIINGTAKVTAIGGTGSAGIGGGDSGSGGSITITDAADVTATGGSGGGAGIGGGDDGSGGTIRIESGTVNATSKGEGPGIGGGRSSNPETTNINISGGTVNTTGGYYAAGIGGGRYTGGGNVNISGGIVTTMGGDSCAGIGAGYESGVPANITITGTPTIIATGGSGTGSNGLLALHSNSSIFIPQNLAYAMSDHATPTTDVTLSTGTDVNFDKQYAKIGVPATISFNANHGSGIMDSLYFIDTLNYTLPEVGFNAPDGKQFDKWDIDGTAYAAGSTVQLTGSAEIKALWKDKLTQALSFSESDIEKTEGDINFTNILTGQFTKVNYNSTNPDVATVNSEGEVTILGVGTTTITATAEEGLEYHSGYSQYSITVQGKLPTNYDEIIDFSGSFDMPFEELEKIIFNNVELNFRSLSDGSYEISGYPAGDTTVIGSAIPGSIVVTLYEAFLKSLPVGNYELTVESAGGEVATLNVEIPQAASDPLPEPFPLPEPTPEPYAVPDTGDDSGIMLFNAICLLALIGIIVVLKSRHSFNK